MIGLFDPRIIRKEFQIPEHIEPTALLLLGHPDKGFLSPERHGAERKPIAMTVRYEKWTDN